MLFRSQIFQYISPISIFIFLSISLNFLLQNQAAYLITLISYFHSLNPRLLKTLSSLLLLILSYTNNFAQGRNNIWCFGDSAGIDFNQSPPVPIVTSVRSRGSCVSIADSLGNLLFYANDRVGNGNNSTRVWNKQDNLMYNGDSIQGEGVYNELVIIPKPGQINFFFLFTGNEVFPGSEGLYYFRCQHGH